MGVEKRRHQAGAAAPRGEDRNDGRHIFRGNTRIQPGDRSRFLRRTLFRRLGLGGGRFYFTRFHMENFPGAYRYPTFRT